MVEMTQFVRQSGVISECIGLCGNARNVPTVGTIYRQLLVSEDSRLEIDRDDLVPSRPRSSVMSQNYMHASSQAMLSANCRDGRFSDILWAFTLSAFTTFPFRFLIDNSGLLRTSLVIELSARF